MSVTDKVRIITAARAIGPSSLRLSWSDGTKADIDLGAFLGDSTFAALCDPDAFAQVKVGDWGHSLTWLSGAELSADMLWFETLSQPGMAMLESSSNGGSVMPYRCRSRPKRSMFRGGWLPTILTARRRCQSRSCWPAGAGRLPTDGIKLPDRRPKAAALDQQKATFADLDRRNIHRRARPV